MPVASVVMPAKNSGQYIHEALESFSRQTISDFELFVVNDHSDDQTAEIVKEWQGWDARINLLDNMGRGVSAARNTGIEASTSRVIVFADSDDVQKVNRLEMQLSFFEMNPDIIACGTAMERFQHQKGVVGYSHPSAFPKSDLNAFPVVVAHIPMPTLAVRRDILVNLDGFDTAFPVAEDIDLVLKLEECGRIANLSDAAVLYRIHQESTSSRHPGKCSHFAGLAMANAFARRNGYEVFPGNTEISELTIPQKYKERFQAQVSVSYLNSLNRNLKAWTMDDEKSFESIRSILEIENSGWIDILMGQRVM